MNILISIHKKYTNQILNGSKTFEFRKKILKNMKAGDTLYIYETVNGGGSGKVVGETRIKKILETNKDNVIDYIYDNWKLENNIFDNTDWFCNYKFMRYFEGIGGCYNFSYCIVLEHVKKYEQPIELNKFRKNRKVITNPPQSMFKIDNSRKKKTHEAIT
jgi:predicted transcriptional regulator